MNNSIARELSNQLVIQPEEAVKRREKLFTEAFVDSLRGEYGKKCSIVVLPVGYALQPLIAELRNAKRPHKVIKAIADAADENAAVADLERRGIGYAQLFEAEFAAHMDKTPLCLIMSPLMPIHVGPYGWRVLIVGVAIANFDGAEEFAMRVLN